MPYTDSSNCPVKQQQLDTVAGAYQLSCVVFQQQFLTILLNLYTATSVTKENLLDMQRRTILVHLL